MAQRQRQHLHKYLIICQPLVWGEKAADLPENWPLWIAELRCGSRYLFGTGWFAWMGFTMRNVTSKHWDQSKHTCCSFKALKWIQVRFHTMQTLNPLLWHLMIAVGDTIRHLESAEERKKRAYGHNKFSLMIIKHLSLHMVNAESIRCNEKDLLAVWECGLKTQTHTEVLHWQSKKTTYQFFLWSHIKHWREPASSCGSSVRVFCKREKERVRETLIIFHLKQSTYRPLFGHFKFIGICWILCPINKILFCQFPNLPIASSMKINT